jgi:hypothetical protein
MAKPELLSHVKFGRLVRALALRRYEALGILEALWQHCWACTSDAVGTAADLAWIVDWPGDPAALAGALAGCGFVDPDPARPGEFRVHDCWRHAPTYARRRLAREVGAEKDKVSSTPPEPVHSTQEGEHAREARDPAPPCAQSVEINPRVLHRLTYELPAGLEAEADKRDELKQLCVHYGLAFDGASISTALDAQARAQLWAEAPIRGSYDPIRARAPAPARAGDGRGRGVRG